MRRGPRAVPRTRLSSPVRIERGHHIQSVLKRHPPGTRFRLASGLHRITSPIVPQDGQVLVGESDDVVLSGAALLTEWTKDGDAPRWYTGNQTQGTGSGPGSCQAGYPRCACVEDVFLDGAPLKHVSTRDEVVSGAYCFDYDADRIYIGDDPTWHTVETSLTPAAFDGEAADVTIENVVVQMFAAPAQYSAIMGGPRWTIRDVEARCNHGGGIEIRDDRRITDCLVHHNGQLGIRGSGARYIVEGTEIAYNNYARYAPGWEAGGTKFSYSSDFELRGNFCHHNIGPGLWLDIDNINYKIYSNTVEDNYATDQSNASGIFLEISYGGQVYDNFVRRNGKGFNEWLWGAGLVIAASGGDSLEVYDNVFTDNEHGVALIQQNRGSGAYGDYLVQNVFVHDNYIRTNGGHGAVQDFYGDSVFTRNNRFDRNVYELVAGGYAWQNTFADLNGWHAAGNDPNPGTIDESGAGGFTPEPLPPDPPDPVPPDPAVPIESVLTGAFTMKLTTLAGAATRIEISANGEA